MPNAAQPVDGASPRRRAAQGRMRQSGLTRMTGFRLVDGSWKMMPMPAAAHCARAGQPVQVLPVQVDLARPRCGRCPASAATPRCCFFRSPIHRPARTFALRMFQPCVMPAHWRCPPPGRASTSKRVSELMALPDFEARGSAATRRRPNTPRPRQAAGLVKRRCASKVSRTASANRLAASTSTSMKRKGSSGSTRSWIARHFRRARRSSTQRDHGVHADALCRTARPHIAPGPPSTSTSSRCRVRCASATHQTRAACTYSSSRSFVSARSSNKPCPAGQPRIMQMVEQPQIRPRKTRGRTMAWLRRYTPCITQCSSGYQHAGDRRDGGVEVLDGVVDLAFEVARRDATMGRRSMAMVVRPMHGALLFSAWPANTLPMRSVPSVAAR